MKTIRYWELSVNTIEVEVPDDYDLELDGDEIRETIFNRIAMCGWDDVDVSDSNMEEV